MQDQSQGICDEVKEVVTLSNDKFGNDENYIKMERFYSEMKKLGLIKKQKYDVPLLDTIGRKLYKDSLKRKPSDDYPKRRR